MSENTTQTPERKLVYEHKPCDPRTPGELLDDIGNGFENFEKWRAERAFYTDRRAKQIYRSMVWHARRLSKAIDAHGQSWHKIMRSWGAI